MIDRVFVNCLGIGKPNPFAQLLPNKINSMSIRRRLFLLNLLLLISFGVWGQNPDRHFKSYLLDNNQLKIEVSDGTISITPYSKYSIEVLFTPEASTNVFPSQAIAASPYTGKTKLNETGDQLHFSTGYLDVTITKQPFKVEYFCNGNRLLSEEKGYIHQERGGGFRFNLIDEEVLMGGGERALGMNRRGHRLQLYNKASYGYETYAELMYYSMPLIISSNKYMVGFDNGASGWLDLGKTEHDIMQFDAVGGRMSYFIVAGDTWPSLISNFSELIGHQPMLPRWALGNISSRMGYHSQDEVESVIDKYLEDDIPLDGVVLDLFWFGPDVKGHMGNLEWDLDSFPEPEQMLKRNAKKGVKTVLITEPFILKESGKYPECAEQNLLGVDSVGNPYIFDFFFGTTALLDIFKPETQYWFWNIYKKHTLSGVDGWWGDLGEPEVHPDDLLHINGRADEVHNLYGHEWSKMVYKGFQSDFPERRPVILMRSGFIGSQRYGLVPWSGDVNRSWGGLQSQVEISLQMGLQGMAYMHSDLGGFAGDYKDAELYTRWLQYGVFQPIYRTHAQEDVPPEPIFWDDTTKNIIRDYIKLRYQLMPYTYTLMHENNTSGLPLMRPLFYIDDKPELLHETTTYLWGDAFLVSPVVEKGISSQSVYLPDNAIWFNYFTGERHKGGQTIDVSVDLTTIPVFVKAGSFVPMVETFQNAEVYSSQNLTVHYYHDASVNQGKGYMYEDDGQSADSYASKKYETIRFEYRNDEGINFTFTPTRFHYNGMPENRTIELVVHNITQKHKKIIINNQQYKVAKHLDDGKTGACYNATDKQLHIRFELSHEAIEIKTK